MGVIIISSITEDRAVGLLSELIALEWGVSPSMAHQIRTAAVLHDVGKSKIPKEILNKQGKLDAHEFEIVKTHTVLGKAMLCSIQGDISEMARNCCELHHHEWHNGNGYWGRRMSELPFYLPFVAIADVFTALVNVRVYKSAWPPGEALDYIRNQAGTQFSGELVGMFIPLVRHNRRASEIYGEAICF